MNIVHIIPSMNTGGAERMLSKLIMDPKINNQKLILLIKDDIKYKLPEDLEIIQLNFKKSIFSVTEVKKLFNALNQLKPDIIQTWLNHPNFLGLLYKKFINKNVKLV